MARFNLKNIKESEIELKQLESKFKEYVQNAGTKLWEWVTF